MHHGQLLTRAPACALELWQVVEVKEAGASGALGVIGQVNGRGTAILSSFAAALGLDAPVEVGA